MQLDLRIFFHHCLHSYHLKGHESHIIPAAYDLAAPDSHAGL